MYSSKSSDRKRKTHNCTDIGISPPRNKKILFNLSPPAASVTKNIHINSMMIKNIHPRISHFNSKYDTIPKNSVINNSIPKIDNIHPRIPQCSISSISKHNNVSAITELNNIMSRTIQKRLYLT